jgi:hypothetical protein
MHCVCNVSCEVRVCAWFEVWVFFVRCEHVKLEVSIWIQSLRLKVWGWRLKHWSLRGLCQVEGMRCEAFCEVKGLRLEMWSRRLKVWGMRFLCQIEGLRSTVWSVKLFAKGWRYLYARSRVWSLKFDEVGGLSFEHFFCEVWGLRLKHFLWGLTFEHSLWGLTIHCSLWSIKFQRSWFFMKFKVWTFNTLCEIWALNITFKVWGLWGSAKVCEALWGLWDIMNVGVWSWRYEVW